VLLKVAYFTNQYPKASHSFIRREICALEQGGQEVQRFALRFDSEQIVDEADKVEHSKTTYILQEPIFYILLRVFQAFFL
jgi:hypothetical protein